MVVEALRRGWPEQILTGRYAFRTRRRDGLAWMMAEGLRLVSDDLIDVENSRQLQIRIDNRPVMVVVKNTGRVWPHVPPGPKACGIDPPGPLLTLLWFPRTVGGWRAWLEPHTGDVLDNRLGAVIGTLATTGGFIRPRHTVIYDPSRRIVGHMRESLLSFVFSWLQLGAGLWMRRLNFVVDGRRVARIRQVSRLWAREFRVDVTGVGGRLDPRLVLACGIQEFAGLSSY
jgi:hypothetical protein